MREQLAASPRAPGDEPGAAWHRYGIFARSVLELVQSPDDQREDEHSKRAMPVLEPPLALPRRLWLYLIALVGGPHLSDCSVVPIVLDHVRAAQGAIARSLALQLDSQRSRP